MTRKNNRITGLYVALSLFAILGWVSRHHLRMFLTGIYDVTNISYETYEFYVDTTKIDPKGASHINYRCAGWKGFGVVYFQCQMAEPDFRSLLESRIQVATEEGYSIGKVRPLSKDDHRYKPKWWSTPDCRQPTVECHGFYLDQNKLEHWIYDREHGHLCTFSMAID